MGQVTIYLDSDTEKKARAAARAERVSLSRWVAGRIERGTKSEWPEDFRKLAGSWPDAPSVEEIRAKYGKDVKRSRL
jgi:hypothetical protein